MMNNKGVVLVMVLWVLLVLSLIAWGLSRRSSLEVAVLDTYQGKLRSYAAARAGVNYVLDLLQRSPSAKDTLYATGVNIDQTKSPETYFGHIYVGNNAYAVVQWPARNFSANDQKIHWQYGLRDEGGKININALGVINYKVLSALLALKGLSQGQADKLALAVVNFTGMNAQASSNNSFMSLNDSLLKPKNKPYENVLELLEVSGMTKEIFDKIKDDVTVYGDSPSGLWINTDTANNDVIEAVANAAVNTNPSLNPRDIMHQAYSVRDGGDGNSFTADDGQGDLAGNTNPSWPNFLQEGTSNFYRARVTGVDVKSGARTVLEAVIHRAPGSAGEILSWQRD